MGVIGLWSILDAGARPVRLEALAKKRLAVDASIWIYQFLKAVRDKEGNVLKNAHVVGFFRRICKLLFHGIQPVFVFDGKAPLLKKQTLRNRKVLREGGRVDVAKTAGKILAVQMRKRALEEAERQKQQQESAAQEEEIPENPVYFEDLELRPAEVQKQRFKKLDQYHLPDLDVAIDRAGSVNDPRIMTQEELQAYAKDYEGGEDMSLYDFSKIDYDSDMFRSLPAADQYSILNAARLRSRLRMGLSTEQLMNLFPDRMAFSRFQIERVKERSDLTNRLMNMNGMNDIGVQRIASEKGREYILVKNETVNGGWSLGVVNSAEKPIVIDKELQEQQVSDDDGLDFEDVPIDAPSTSAEYSTVGMTEDDMIRFAMEESRKAQLSTKKPDADYRPSSGWAQSRQQDTQTISSMKSGQPLFLRDDSLVESEFRAHQDEGHGNMEANEVHAIVPRTTRGEEEAEVGDEATDLEQAIALSLELQKDGPATEANAGGFIAEADEDDIQLPLIPNPDSSNKREERQKPVAEKFSLPFAKLDFTQSLLSKGTKTNENHVALRDSAQDTLAMAMSPLDKLQKAMLAAQEGDRVGVEDAPRSEIQAIQETSETTAQSDKPKGKSQAALPTWFNEEVDRTVDRSNPTIEIAGSSAHENILSTRNTFDLTNDLSDAEDDSVVTPTSHYKSPKARKSLSSATSGAAAQTTAPTDTMKDSSLKNAVQVIDVHSESDEDPASPDWSEEDVELPTTSGVADSSDIRKSPDHDTSLPIDDSHEEQSVPVLDTETSMLDEVDQNRLLEEEDLLNRMDAEEDEYARFSAELGNKRADNYTNTEYEQDLKALKNQQRRNLRDADEVTQIMVQECQELLAQFGIPFITAASEAESQCAQLVQQNLVDGIVTDDSDVFLFGGTRVYRNMFNAAKTVECYVLSDLEREFELTREKLIKLAHLLGSDYTEGIKKIGPVLALELIAEFEGHAGLEEFRDYVDRVQSGTENEEDKVSVFRKKFRKTAEKLVLPDNFPNPLVKDAYLNPEVDEDSSSFEWGQPDVDALRSFLMRSCGWRQEYTDSQLLPVIKDMNLKLREGTQRNLTDFFSGSVGAGAGGGKKLVKSARMHNALTSLRGASISSTDNTPSRKRARKDGATTNQAAEAEAEQTSTAVRKKRTKKARVVEPVESLSE